MRLLGESLGVEIKVYGPDTHITTTAPFALGIQAAPKNPLNSIPPIAPGLPKASTSTSPAEPAIGTIHPDGERTQPNDQIDCFDTKEQAESCPSRPWFRAFDATTRSFVSTVEDAVKKHPDADVVFNFALSRSVYPRDPDVPPILRASRSLLRASPNVMLARSSTSPSQRVSSSLALPLTPLCVAQASLSPTSSRTSLSCSARLTNTSLLAEPSCPRPYTTRHSYGLQELGLICKPAAVISTISDERGQELLYTGMRIFDVFKEDIGLGGVISLLWFKRCLPPWATKFIERVLMLTADHGLAVLRYVLA